MIRFTTAGESHGKALVAILEGVPAGMELTAVDIDRDLRRRMSGYGRGARMNIEDDSVEFLAGVRAGVTLGSPIALIIRNRDWENWSDVMAAEPDAAGAGGRRRRVTRPRPGHADLAGVLKYDRADARDVLERASARETAARVACGGVCKKLLDHFGVEIGSHVVELGEVRAQLPDELPTPLNEVADKSPVRCVVEEASEAMVAEIEGAMRDRDTLGGVAEVVARGLVVGLGSHVSWDKKLDGRLARAIMSIPAVKGVEIGLGFEAARRRGSQVHDEISPEISGARSGYSRASNRAGGLEGGMTNGETLWARVAMKPISTLRKPLVTVDFATGEAAKAQSERSDVTAVPAMGVVAEAMTALVLADAMVEKFGGDSVGEMTDNFKAYTKRLATRWAELGGSRKE
jgi:chorismate synthase